MALCFSNVQNSCTDQRGCKKVLSTNTSLESDDFSYILKEKESGRQRTRTSPG